MNLAELRLGVREKLVDFRQTYFTDAQIDKELNGGLRTLICSVQPLNDTRQFSTVIGSPEYTLWRDLEQILQVVYTDGQDFVLDYSDFDELYEPTKIVGLPERYYTKVLSNKKVQQGASGVAPTIEEAVSGNPQDYRIILGLYPAPSAVKTVTVNFYKRAPKMVMPTDCPPIPEEYHTALQDWALAELKEKDEFYQESNHYRAKFKQWSDKFQSKMQRRGVKGFPRVKMYDDTRDQRNDGTPQIYIGRVT